ncbi:MAG: Gx transporter family protein [Clostridia bacterium]|jgi:heptaprenyl diphosphate synthase|nr:Gx transporter family protein [Clostridia bacterium]MBR5545042.1 Gx transporter family protein [Clostridia bacterium]
MKKHIRKTAVLSILTTVALVLSYVEAILPPIWAAVPGIKIGLPNIIIIFILYKTGLKDAITVSVIRLFLVALLFGNAMTLLYSAAGAILSIALMTLCKKINLFSMVGVSIVGGVAHNLGQILVAMAIFETSQIGYYMLVLAVTGTIAGVFVGIAASIILKRFEKIKI